MAYGEQEDQPLKFEIETGLDAVHVQGLAKVFFASEDWEHTPGGGTIPSPDDQGVRVPVPKVRAWYDIDGWIGDRFGPGSELLVVFFLSLVTVGAYFVLWLLGKMMEGGAAIEIQAFPVAQGRTLVRIMTVGEPRPQAVRDATKFLTTLPALEQRT